MRTVEVGIYKFSELSDSAKDKAREWWRECESQEFGAFGELWEPAQTAGAILGIDFDMESHQLHGGKTRQEPHIMYSGFSSQGDGASFTGTYTFKPGCSEAIRQEFGTDTTLHNIADKLTALHNTLRLKDGGKLEGKITQDSNHYVHARTMDATAYDANGDEREIAVSDEFRDLMRDFADWIYKSLEAEYDWRMSDECVDDNIEANEYEFTEDGERA